MASNTQPLEVRVEKSLQRLGYNEIRAVRVRDGHINLVGQLPPGEESMVVAVARTVAGVTVVTNKLG